MAKNGIKNGNTLNTFPESDVKEEKKKSKKNLALHYCSFVVKGIKEHYNDGWNWIDSAFLILSLVAVILWATIVREHITGISSKSFKDFGDVSNNEIFLSLS